MTIKTRFAPSPTGNLHIGGVRTAIFNWLFAKSQGGKFYLRIEDTDQERSNDKFVDSILDGLNWLGINNDDEIIYQSKNITRHQDVAKELISSDKAYYCYATSSEIESFKQNNPGKKFVSPWRDKKSDPGKAVVRLKVSNNGITKIKDMVLGDIEVQNAEIDDMVLLRSDGTPTYLLSCVVDDFDMDITHVIRGNDHLTNTFRQIQILNALNWKIPHYAHIPLIHNNDGGKLSKRDGALGTDEYKKSGFLPEALFNCLLKLGWSKGNNEIISIQEAINIFELKDVNKSPAKFDLQKLRSINQHYIQETSNEIVFEYIMDALGEKIRSTNKIDIIKNAIPLIKTRVSILEEALPLAEVFIAPLSLMDDKSEEVMQYENFKEIVQELYNIYLDVKLWDVDTLKQLSKDLAKNKEIKFPNVMKTLRTVTLGTFTSPPIFETIAIIGKTEVLERMKRFI
ncbi:MAG: glutamyl-tRNA synthetase [Candidatus Midichloriaceae bacterium]|jgi:glutamyl-tRNA synthetase